MSDEATTPTKRVWKTWQLVTAAGVALLLGIGIGGAGGGDSENASTDRPTTTERDEATETTKRTTTTRRVTTTEAPYVPAAADFGVAIVITEKNCFGSAGCNVTYEIELSYNGPRPLEPSSRWRLTYEVRGGEDVEIGSVEVSGSGEYTTSSESISTPSSESQLTAIVTAVREL